MKSYWCPCSYAQSWYWSHVRQATHRKNRVFQRKIPASAEIKKGRDWLRPWTMGRHSVFWVYKRMLIASNLGSVPFIQTWSVSDLVLCLPANKVLLHSALKSPDYFFFSSLKSFGPTEKCEVDLWQYQPWLEWWLIKTFKSHCNETQTLTTNQRSNKNWQNTHLTLDLILTNQPSKYAMSDEMLFHIIRLSTQLGRS